MLDGLSLWAVRSELQPLVGGKLDKIQQPERDALLLTVRTRGSSERLLLCAHPENGRVQLTRAQYPNPPEPPAFCMLLRRRFTGGRIRAIEQPGLDRVLKIEIEAPDELGDISVYALYVELMGRHSNIAAVNGAGMVMDCARHVGAGMSVRVLLPGVPYVPPPAQDKLDPREAGEEDFLAALSREGKVNRLLSGAFFGLSPATGARLTECFIEDGESYAQNLSDGERRALARGLYEFYREGKTGRFSPTLVLSDAGEAVAVHPFRPALPAEALRAVPTMGEALDAFYAERDVRERIRRRSASLQKVLQNQLERCQNKLAVFEQTLASQEDLDRLRLQGELIMANLHSLRRGMQAAKLWNYYADPPEECVVPLDERLSPQENAQRCFKKYQKGKAAKALAVTQREETLRDIAYLESQQDNIRKCTTDGELAEIREELEREGYARREQTRLKQPKRPPSKPLHYISSDGIGIFVGKNNQQNDALTLRQAAGENIWLHTKNIPGSHVIIDYAGEPPENTLKEAAMLAAYYSKARASASVPVDYCPRKFVKKPAGARPGMVIYTTNRTLYVTPDEGAVRAMKTVD